MIKAVITYIYEIADLINYSFFGNRGYFDRPLFLYKKEIRDFIKDYGQHSRHFEFKSRNKEEQINFLRRYSNYLAEVKGIRSNELQKHNIKYKSPSLRFGSCYVFFKNGELMYWYSKSSKERGGGSLGLSFELNLEYY